MAGILNVEIWLACSCTYPAKINLWVMLIRINSSNTLCDTNPSTILQFTKF